MVSAAVAGVRLTKFFGRADSAVAAIRDVAISVDFGQLVALVGPSGSGKSTLLKLLAGIELPQSGEVAICGASLPSDDDGRAELRLRTIGLVFQDDGLIEEFTAAENVRLPLELVGFSRSESIVKAQAALAELGVGDLMDRFPAEMSGGQRQRVGLARAIAGGKRILLCDEPTGNLDSITSRHVFQTLHGLADRGCAVLVSTHDESIIQDATSVLRLVDGQLI